MIANLIYTLMLALGVATGNVSSNSYKGGNAFNHGEKSHIQPIKKTNYNSTSTYRKVNEYRETRHPTGLSPTFDQYHYNSKWYIGDTVTYNSDIATIYNSTYVDIVQNNPPYNYAANNSYLVGIYNITPYLQNYGNEITIDCNYLIQMNGVYTTTFVRRIKVFDVPNTYKSYIDLTTYNALDMIQQFQGPDNELAQYKIKDEELENSVPAGTTFGLDYTFNVGSINTEKTYIITTIVFQRNLTLDVTSQIQITPDNFTITGNVVPVNYEVVDIPELMFTILTLPFSWYSTAFNLTVFPGTPYALNFGNIVLTIVAALMLIYLIKKVLK